jgi:hypothetical protein
VSPDIIDRVVRLNPNPVEGDRMRGIHYKCQDDPRVWFGAVGKGEFIRRFGRAAFQALNSTAILKRGRRVYIRRAYLYEAGA